MEFNVQSTTPVILGQINTQTTHFFKYIIQISTDLLCLQSSRLKYTWAINYLLAFYTLCIYNSETDHQGSQVIGTRLCWLGGRAVTNLLIGKVANYIMCYRVQMIRKSEE